MILQYIYRVLIHWKSTTNFLNHRDHSMPFWNICQVIPLLLGLPPETMGSCLLYVNLLGPESAPIGAENCMAHLNKSSVSTFYQGISPHIIYELHMNDGSRGISFLCLKVCRVLKFINQCFWPKKYGGLYLKKILV